MRNNQVAYSNELVTLISFGGIGFALPFPVLSMNFFKSVLRYSKTCSHPLADLCLQFETRDRAVLSYQVQAGLVVLFNMFYTQQPAHQQPIGTLALYAFGCTAESTLTSRCDCSR